MQSTIIYLTFIYFLLVSFYILFVPFSREYSFFNILNFSLYLLVEILRRNHAADAFCVLFVNA